MNLPLSNRLVERVSFDYAITLLIDDGFEFRLETLISVHVAGGDTRLIDPEQVDPRFIDVLALLHRRVVSAHVDDRTGALSLVFSNDWLISVEPNRKYEAWTYNAPDGTRIVCMPGGELAIWDPEE